VHHSSSVTFFPSASCLFVFCCNKIITVEHLTCTVRIVLNIDGKRKYTYVISVNGQLGNRDKAQDGRQVHITYVQRKMLHQKQPRFLLRRNKDSSSRDILIKEKILMISLTQRTYIFTAHL